MPRKIENASVAESVRLQTKGHNPDKPESSGSRELQPMSREETQHLFVLSSPLPSDIGDQRRERHLPRVHLDDPDAGHHFVHDADSVVGQHGRFAPLKRKKNQ